MAEEVLQALIRDRNRQRDLKRWASPDWFGDVGQALLAITQGRPTRARSATGTPFSTVESWVTVREAAAEAGVSTRRVTALARRGDVVAKRIGSRLWLVDLESVRSRCGRGRRPDGRDGDDGG